MKIKAYFNAFSLPIFFLLYHFSPFSNRQIDNSTEINQVIDDFIHNTPSLPRYAEGGYSPLGRSPVVDVLLADPFYIPTYAEIVTNSIKEYSHRNDIFGLATSLQIAGGVPAAPFSKGSLLQNEYEVPDQFQQSFPPMIAAKIGSYWHTFMHIQHEVMELISVLSEDEKAWVKKQYNRFFFEKQEGDADYDFFSTDSNYPLEFFNLAAKLDLAKLIDCFRKLSVIAQDFYDSQQEFAEIKLNDDFVWEENKLKLIISQKENVEHRESADFFIDLGGHNKIYNNAGGTEGERALALHLDLKGNNQYQGRNFVQGSGFLGVGLLTSCGGNNTYDADAYSQGCGFYGVGGLVNMKGENRFTLNFGGESFGLFGFSMLWNKEGKNTYLAKQGMAQAATSTLGVAFLIDNQGNNSYISGELGKGGTRYGGMGQGGSAGVRYYPWLNNPTLYGGLSFLYVGGGSNIFHTPWLGQGSAYLLSAGIVVAEGSNDTFLADYDAQGQGLHLAAGLLLKKGQENHFNGGWGSLGVSGDRAVGMFIGIGGKNHYEGTNQSIGTSRKPKSVGVFIDVGSNNTYLFKKQSNARLQYPQSPREWSSALFLEAGKDSSYPVDVDEFKRGNDMRWGIDHHSLGISTKALGDNYQEELFTKFHKIPHVPFPFDPVNGWSRNTAFRPLMDQPEKAQQLANEIATADYGRRRQIYESLDLMRFKNRKLKFNLSGILKNPTGVDEDAFNYAILWALRNKDKVDLTEIKKAISTKAFTSEYARKMGVSLVGTFWSLDAAPILEEVMLNDPSEEIRYFAALALTLNLPASFKSVLVRGLKGNSEIVRYAIAKGLQESKNPYALSLVVSLFDDPSFYVRRAAGMTALSLGDKNGISVVLDTLQFDTLDTEENYGDNIYSQLAAYLDVNFGLDKQAWIDWWNGAKNDYKLPIQKSDPD